MITRPVGYPNIGNEQSFLERVKIILDNRWLTNNGPMVQEFENKIATITNTRYAIAICNASIAMTLVAKCLNLQGEIIVPSYTFIASAHSMLMAGLKPIFADINPSTHTLCPLSVSQLITQKTAAILGVHLWGRGCDVNELEDLAHANQIPLIFDAAHAFGASYKGQKIGSFGVCEVFSFHATKFVNSFEGGVITTNDHDLAEKLKLARNFGFSGVDNVISWGTNAKMSEICAAMGLTNIEAMSDFIKVNSANYTYLKKLLEGSVNFRVFEFNPKDEPNYQYLLVEIIQIDNPLDIREKIIESLHQKGYLARKYFWPSCHKMQPYVNDSSHTPIPLVQTELVANRVIVLPTGFGINNQNLDEMVSILNQNI